MFFEFCSGYTISIHNIALFLQNFVSKKIPFAHIDIAGPAFSDKSGGTGFGTKMIIEWIKRQGQE